jgi:hypothetical protein
MYSYSTICFFLFPHWTAFSDPQLVWEDLQSAHDDVEKQYADIVS